jgi:hypothetical protein
VAVRQRVLPKARDLFIAPIGMAKLAPLEK